MFLGVEYHFAKAPFVLATQVGYSGGQVADPSYEMVCRGDTQHAETVLVIYDKTQTDYAAITKLFFEIHNPTQSDRQGPDIGSQYRSEIFYLNERQKDIATSLINELREKKLDVVTKLSPATSFWPAEKSHQAYYQQKGGTPYCHSRVKRWDD